MFSPILRNIQLCTSNIYLFFRNVQPDIAKYTALYIKYSFVFFVEGMFSPDIAKYAALYKKAKLKEYQYQQQVYYTNLLKEILVNRQVHWTHASCTQS